MPVTPNIDSIQTDTTNRGCHLSSTGEYGEAQTFYNYGNALLKNGDFKQAVGFYQKAIDIAPTFVDAHNNMGLALSKMGSLLRALDCYLAVIRLQPDLAHAYNNLGNTFFDLGSKQKAIACYQKAIELKADFAHAYHNLGYAYESRGRIDKATSCLKKAQEILPGDPSINFGFGLVFQKMGDYYSGLRYLDRACKLDPDFLAARFNFHLSLPLLYKQKSEISSCRRRFEKGLDELIDIIELQTVPQQKAALAAIGSFTSFYLAYQGQNDLKLQKQYGKLVCRILKSCFPQWTTSMEMPVRKMGEKIRIGFISAYLHSHTVAKLFLGWIKNLDADEFDIYCYYLKNKSDHVTEDFKKASRFFYHCTGGPESVAGQITADNLHILVYLDVGMFAPTTRLAGLRLAPVQCVAWGHPVTTGLPTMNYFISSELMEPQDAADHYSEKLIRLPNISISYQPPVLPKAPKTRKQFGIEKDAFVYLSPQSLFKYLPQYDFIYPNIALEVPNAKFVFISNDSRSLTRIFKKRIEQAFLSFELEAGSYCVFQPRLASKDYLSLNLAADVMLDTMDWSGGKTALEAIYCNLPIVTRPGAFMRGRHSYAMLRIMEIDDTVAADEIEYIQTAVRLAKDRDFYQKIKMCMKMNKNRLFNDATAVAALGAFFRSIVPGNSKNAE